MVGKVHLQRHHPLRAGQLPPGGRGGAEQRRALDQLLQLCRQRLDAFREQRGEELDQIVPSNHGGSDDLSNLQALCFRCNADKRVASCMFCALEGSGRVLVENELELYDADASR